MPTTRAHRRRRIAVTLVITSALGACSGGGASKEVATLQSWRATIDLAARARTRGWVTPRYVRQLREEAQTELAAAEKLAASEKTPPAVRDSVSSARGDLQRSLAELDRTGR